ncbi:hypothetical protein NN3_20100 [Nocardia neocaledoniensis NBRC 108232]|uniref:Uncharacterized protein n=1 Tax=Nocardia neocaledoniensis TaxID=236511 RepID=A0A317N3E2_9NOCA|nr:hypothetical protein [Nocardia neocaledoniensis]PWV67777.1 hypothetical protein DFR69_11991 [Nocardia neocaledoniensis]GEM31003.1 hypothetical protein NN3_20100 [Nocardia neocaledoniensis NBRC 108232]
MVDKSPIVVAIAATTNADDLSYLALADLAAAGAELDHPDPEWRIIGAHMVQLLIHVYPTSAARLRGTTDADTGVSAEIAASQHFHDQLLGRAYTDRTGNNYQRDYDGKANALAVDILVPVGVPGTTAVLNGRGFDNGPCPGRTRNTGATGNAWSLRSVCPTFGCVRAA